VEPSSIGAEIAGLKGETRIEEPDRAQRAIARRTAETRATVPDLELYTDVDLGAALALAAGRDCSLTAILVRACALALREHPRANGAYRDGRYELYSRVNVGVTVHTDDAYATPTVLDADTKSLAELTEELDVFTRRARDGQLTSPEQAGSTFTLSDLSGLGVDRWSVLVTPPQAAALAAGAVRSVPAVRHGEVVPGHLIGLTLGCDHRILFGTQAGAFLDDVAGRLAAAEL
jgi:pyruvate dehydrogenase E2 component (dihydrolipoamide acetyltransferase)